METRAGYPKIVFRKGDKFVSLELMFTWHAKTSAEVATFHRRAGKFGQDLGPQFDKGSPKLLGSHAEARALLSQDYTEEQRADVLLRVPDEGVSEAARKSGVSLATVSRGAREARVRRKKNPLRRNNLRVSVQTVRLVLV